MPNLSDNVAKWTSLAISAIGVLISLAVAVGVVFVMRDDIQDNEAAIQKLEEATQFAERIKEMEVILKEHSREIENQGAYGWRINALEQTVGLHEQKLSDQVRDDWVSWRTRTDSRLDQIERNTP